MFAAAGKKIHDLLFMKVSLSEWEHYIGTYLYSENTARITEIEATGVQLKTETYIERSMALTHHASHPTPTSSSAHYSFFIYHLHIALF